MTNSKWTGICLAVLVGVSILALPTPAGLSSPAQSVLAVAAFTIMLWLFQVMNNGVASILMMGLMVFIGARPQLVLSGFASPSFWILVCVLYYGCAMHRTGLAQRLSYYILSLFPGTYRGILAAFFLIGLVLALGIPSMTVRTAIMVPIAWALVQSLEIAPRSRGSALIVLTSIEMAVLPGCALLYGSLFGPVVDSVFQAKQFPLSWLGYAKVMTIPTLILCVLILAVNPLIMRPEKRLAPSPSFAKEKLKALGSMQRAELITIAIVVLSIAYWATDRIHHLPSFLIGMFGLAIFALAGIIRDEDIGGGVSWTLLLFIGGVFGLANMIQEYKVTDWLAAIFLPIAEKLAFSSIALLLVMALAFLLMRFLDPTGFIAIPVLFLPVSGVMTAAGIPPLVLVAPILLSAAPFWLSHQNFWIAMGEGMTSNQAFTAGQRASLANVYAALVLITLVISVGYWKLIGLL
jgi:divalent anion:Na+ symporter, DASS family